MTDAARGIGEQAKGHVKRVAGKALDDNQLEEEGSAQARKGREQMRADEHKAKAELAEAEQRAAQKAK